MKAAIQAKDIPDLEFLGMIESLMREKSQQGRGEFRLGTGRYVGSPWVMWPEVCAAMPDIPAKVVLAKARALIRRSLLDGCFCGCRGDWHLTENGDEFMRRSVAPTPEPPK